MLLKKVKPTNNSLRHQVKITKFQLSKKSNFVKFFKSKVFRSFGRSSSTGHITAWHRGGGHKRVYKKIKFNNDGTHSIVVTIMYDSFRSSFICLNFDLEKKVFFLTLSTNNVYPGCFFTCNPSAVEKRLGYRMQLSGIPLGSFVSNLSFNQYEPARYIRAAGTFGQIIECIHTKSRVKLPSGKILDLSSGAYATIGINSNSQHFSTVLGKAGKSRNLGKRPKVRGIAMNPVDHPHGGRTNGGRPSVTPWGLPTKGKFRLKK